MNKPDNPPHVLLWYDKLENLMGSNLILNSIKSIERRTKSQPAIPHIIRVHYVTSQFQDKKHTLMANWCTGGRKKLQTFRETVSKNEGYTPDFAYLEFQSSPKRLNEDETLEKVWRVSRLGYMAHGHKIIMKNINGLPI